MPNNDSKRKMFKDSKTINYRTPHVYNKNLEVLSQQVAEYGLHSSQLKEFLLASSIIEEIPHQPSHDFCTFQSASHKDAKHVTEKRICRCMYYYNLSAASPEQKQKCVDCDFPSKWKNISDCQILDYEVPMPKVVDNVGGIDLLLQAPDNRMYAVEVKPAGSNETLARMIAEILTYCEISDYSVTHNGLQYSVIPAICFLREVNSIMIMRPCRIILPFGIFSDISRYFVLPSRMTVLIFMN